MLVTAQIHPEGPRYGASLVFLPGLWVGSDVWRGPATFFGHRGWQGTLVDLRGVPGGIAARGRAVAEIVSRIPGRVVLAGHDAGALVALAAAGHESVAALVLVSPLVAGSAATHTLTWSWGLVWAAMRRRLVAPPRGPLADAAFADLPETFRRTLASDDAATVAEIGRRDRLERPATLPPTLILHGDADPLLRPHDARRLAEDLGADARELSGAGHWPIAGPAWQTCVRQAHRWLVQRLGEGLLELYPEAMAERDDADEEPS